MRKRNRKRQHHVKAKGQYSQTRQRIINMKPEDLVVYVHQAEKEALPTIKELEISAGVAIFLVAQYTQAFVTGKPEVTIESARNIATRVLVLWQTGFYQPGPEYPFSLEETLLDIENGMNARKDYSESFQPFTPAQPSAPVGLGQLTGGIVLHPKTHLWQIWMMLDGPCEFLGAYRDASTAQKNLEIVINAVRQGEKPEAALSLYRKLMSQAVSESQQLPFDMLTYLVSNVQKYTILL